MKTLACIKNVKRGNDKKRPDPPSVYVVGTSCTDRSASMNVMGKAVLDGMNAFLEMQKECAKKENREETTFWRHVTFDTCKNVIYKGDSDSHNFIKEAFINPEDLVPRNMTRLYDTAIEEIEILCKKRDNMQKNLPKFAKKLDIKVIAFFTLLTDGQDNQSGNNSNIKMRQMIEKARKEGVVCTFLGANQNAEFVGPEYGFSQGNSLTFSTNAPIGEKSDDTGIYNALRSASSNVARACSSGGGDCISFSKMQRTSSAAPREYKVLPSKKKKISKIPYEYNSDYTSDDDDDINNLPPIPKPLSLRRS